MAAGILCILVGLSLFLYGQLPSDFPPGTEVSTISDSESPPTVGVTYLGESGAAERWRIIVPSNEWYDTRLPQIANDFFEVYGDGKFFIKIGHHTFEGGVQKPIRIVLRCRLDQGVKSNLPHTSVDVPDDFINTLKVKTEKGKKVVFTSSSTICFEHSMRQDTLHMRMREIKERRTLRRQGGV